MKSKTLIAAILVAGSMTAFGCKGGASGEKSDSTMLDTQARDSAAATATQAQGMDSAAHDTTKKDTAVKM
ncbi:hypothetical protein [Mucilaginibacter sp. KACC 22063]|uniref:hypothetical protein n=1 Tax=Mucilaginibacter sp. KACC 22063 TaxID=3025666 RepID=UPI002365EAB7|nr:hypothetical protein [Mucilaginibacter sp. KACC 22063]WDF53725.1 hypothetical protein PQ461_12295 [Mucilaginibacter sp. KACC 22063]